MSSRLVRLNECQCWGIGVLFACGRRFEGGRLSISEVERIRRLSWFVRSCNCEQESPDLRELWADMAEQPDEEVLGVSTRALLQHGVPEGALEVAQKGLPHRARSRRPRRRRQAGRDGTDSGH